MFGANIQAWLLTFAVLFLETPNDGHVSYVYDDPLS